MIDTAGNPHTDGSAAPRARPRHRPSRHSYPPATSQSHDNWMVSRQTSCRQQTAPPQPRCSKDVTAHPHRPGARPGRPCPVPARSGQQLSCRSGFSPAFGTEFFYILAGCLRCAIYDCFAGFVKSARSNSVGLEGSWEVFHKCIVFISVYVCMLSVYSMPSYWNLVSKTV